MEARSGDAPPDRANGPGKNNGHHEQQEAPVHHHPHHYNHNPRELKTFESVLEYMHEVQDEQPPPPQQQQFKSYLKAQKAMKQARSRRNIMFGGGDAAAADDNTNYRYNSLRVLSVRKSAAKSHLNLDMDGILPEEEEDNQEVEPEADEEEKEEDENSHKEANAKDMDQDGHTSLTVPWYCRPVQRQRWDDDQVLPHINWGDLFFDLFYVAAAYNLGGMLISAMNRSQWPRGVVYFIAIFGTLYNIWEADVVYSSRFTLVDYAHRIVAVVRFFCVSFAVLSIKPIYLLGDQRSVETFSFTLALFCESILQLGLHVELYFYGDGDRRAIQNHTWRKIKTQFIPASLTYMVAAIIAGVSFFSSEDHDGHYEPAHPYQPKEEDPYGHHGEDGPGYDDHDPSPNGTVFSIIAPDDDPVGQTDHDGHFLFRWLAAAATSSCKDGHRLLAGGGYAEDPCCQDGGGHRFLAGGSESDPCAASSEGINWSIADVPLILCLAIYVYGICNNLLWKCINSKPAQQKDIREHYVPNNIDFMIHRYGEWIMLMIGESILSLLIVETTESEEYYLIAGLGCLTVIVLQLLKFESEPSHADGHALWRSMFAASLFNFMIQILSMGLIAFGVSYKIMLTNVYKHDIEAEEGGGDDHHRHLAAIPVISDFAVASLYCGALAFVLLSLEMMLGSHKGVTKAYQLLFHEIESFHFNALNWPLLFISLFKLFIICFTATLSQWVTEPGQVALIGFLIVTSMAITRIAGWGLVHHEDQIKGAISFVADQTMDLGRNVVKTTQAVGTDLVLTTHSAVRTTGSMAAKTLKAATSMGLEMGEKSQRSFNSTDEFALERAIWDTSFDAIVVTDRVGVIKYVNSTVLNEFGYADENELVGRNVSVLVGGGEADCHHMYMDRFNKNDKASTTIGKQRKLKARKKDGNEFACLIGIREIPNTGLLIGYIRPTEDLALLRAEPDKDYHVDDTSFDSIIVIALQGVIIDVNRTTVNEFGFASKEELIGSKISMLVGGGEADNHDMYLANFDKERKNASTIGNQRVLHAKRKDGTEFPCVIGIKRAPQSGYLIGYIRNMTGIAPEDAELKEKTKYLVDDTSFDSIIVTDAEGTMLQVNATAVEEFGYKAKAELVGQNVSILVGGGHAKHHGKYMKKFHKKNKDDTAIGKQRTLRARRKDGTHFTCVIGIKSIPGTDCLIGYIRSTEGLTKKQIAAEYDSVSNISTGRSTGSHSGASLASASAASNGGGDILDESFDAVVVTDFEGVIQRVNQTVLDIFRYESKDELVGKNISILVGGGEARRHDAYLKNFQQEGKASSQIGKQRVLYSKRKDGTEFPCIVGIKRTPKNDGLVGWIRDMSDIQEKRSSIQITNMKMLDPVERLVDDSSFDAIIVTDFKGIIRRVNQTTVREFQYASKEELIGKNVSDLVGGKVSAKTHDKYLERFQKAGKSSSTIGKQRILKSKRKDGSEFRCIIGINKIEGAKEELLVGYIRNLDITHEVNDSSDAGAESRSLSTFASGK